MAGIISDEFDFSSYMRQTDASAKVRKASAFHTDMLKRFEDRSGFIPKAVMHSTKLRTAIEFRPGEVTAWAGYNGHKKSMFTGQVALDLIAAGERVLMASFEMYPAETLARMARQCYGVPRPSPADLERFSEWTDGRLWMLDHLGRISAEQCIAVVRYFGQELKGAHVFIDSMMMVCKSEEHLDEQKQFATDVVRAAQEYGLHIHLITHCRKPQSGEEKPPTKYDLRGSAAISDQAHNVITIWANKAKKATLEAHPGDAAALAEPDARVCVEKQRNGSFEGAFRLWFSDASLRFLDARDSRQEAYVMGAL